MIPLYVENGTAYVWNSNDWHVLRSKYRICGALIGSAPSFPRQNDFQGLPMALMTEEAALLVDIDVCELIQLPNITKKLDEELKREVAVLEQKSLQEQKEALRKRRCEQLSQKIDVIFAGKKQKLLSKGLTDVNLNKEALLQEEISKLPQLASAHVLEHLPTEHYIRTETRKMDVNCLNPDFSDNDSCIRYAVYKNLWAQGLYITSGSKFGADFLVYLGDPVKFHALYMVRCLSNPNTLHRSANLVTFGRLSVSVNKLAVFAFCNNHGEIEYQTLQWHDSIH